MEPQNYSDSANLVDNIVLLENASETSHPAEENDQAHKGDGTSPVAIQLWVPPEGWVTCDDDTVSDAAQGPEDAARQKSEEEILACLRPPPLAVRSQREASPQASGSSGMSTREANESPFPVTMISAQGPDTSQWFQENVLCASSVNRATPYQTPVVEQPRVAPFDTDNGRQPPDSSGPNTACLVCMIVVSGISLLFCFMSGAGAFAFSIKALMLKKEGKLKESRDTMQYAWGFIAASFFIAVPLLAWYLYGHYNSQSP